MASLRATASVALCAGLAILATAARACDERYPSTCKPVPSIDPPAASAESSKAASKPLQITSRRGRAAKPAKATKATAKVERSVQAHRTRNARKASARRWVARARHAKVAAARMAAEEAVKSVPTASTKIAPVQASEAARRPVLPPPRVADGSNEPNTGFAAIWMERSSAPVTPAEAVETAPASQTGEPASSPLPARPVQVASQNEVNEIDLAAADPPPPTDSFWVRGLFIALGGLLAVGSALRLFM